MKKTLLGPYIPLEPLAWYNRHQKQPKVSLILTFYLGNGNYVLNAVVL